MKNLLLLTLSFAAFLLAGCRSDRSIFSNSGLIFSNLKGKNNSDPQIRMSSEGIYRFDICAHDTLFHDTNIQWFCDCGDPKSEGSVDSFAMAFIDEIRVIFFKRPNPKREINLKDPGKETKIGVYYWEFQYFDGSARRYPQLVVRIKSPRSDKTKDEYSDLFFEKRGVDLELVEMTYFDRNNSLNDMARRVKRNKKTGPLAESPKEGRRTIRPRDVFALSEMLYCYVSEPITLKIESDTIAKIEYAANGDGEFVRTTKLKKGGLLQEWSSNQKSICTW